MRRVNAQGGTLEEKRPRYGLEEVPRPVAAFLLGGCKLKPHQTLTACLRELAAEGVVRYETDAAGMPFISLSAPSPRSGRPLLPFERVALARVRSRAARLPRVPFSALVSDDGDDYENWAKEQEEEIGQEARRAGLAVKAPPRGCWQTVFSLIAAAAGTVAIIHAANYKTGDAIAGPVFAAAVIALFVPLFLRRWRLTAPGAEAVRCWRRAGRGVPGMPGVTWGPGDDTGVTAWALDGPAAAPLPKDQAWSSLGGQWHTVTLASTVSRPYWSNAAGLGLVLVVALMASVPAGTIGVFALGFDALGKLIAITPAALAAFVIAVFWLPSFTSRMARPDSVTLPAEVVKLQYVDGGSDSPDRYLVWLDDGSPVSRKFDVEPAVYRRLSVGDTVQMTWSPRRRSLDDLGAAPSGASHPALPPAGATPSPAATPRAARRP